MWCIISSLCGKGSAMAFDCVLVWKDIGQLNPPMDLLQITLFPESPRLLMATEIKPSHVQYQY